MSNYDEADNALTAGILDDDDKTLAIASDIAVSPPVEADQMVVDDEKISQVLDEDVEVAEDACILRDLLSGAGGVSESRSQKRVLPKSLLLTHEIEHLVEQQSQARHDLRESASQTLAAEDDGNLLSQCIVRPGPLRELPRNGRVICFDVETTGFSINDCIVEIGAVEVIDGMRTGMIFQSKIVIYLLVSR
jgi:hypothetical protein